MRRYADEILSDTRWGESEVSDDDGEKEAGGRAT